MSRKLFNSKPLEYEGAITPCEIAILCGGAFLAILLVGFVVFNSTSRKEVADSPKDDTSLHQEIAPTYSDADNNDEESEEEEKTQPSESSISRPARVGIAQPEGLDAYRVLYVIDGDTIKIDYNGGRISVRMIGINTPETKDPRKPQECFGVESSNYAKSKLEGKTIYLEFDPTQGTTDKYNRLLAFVYVDGYSYNYDAIRDGYAYEYTYNVPYKYQSEFKSAQSYASSNNVGLWAPSTCNGQK